MLLLGLSISPLGKPFPIDNALAEAAIGDARSHRLARQSVSTAPRLRPLCGRLASSAAVGRLVCSGRGHAAGPVRSFRALARPSLGTAPRLDHPHVVHRSGPSTGHFAQDASPPRAGLPARLNRLAQQPPRRPPRPHRRRRPDDEAGQARSLVLATLLTAALVLTLTPPASGAHAAVEEASQ